MPIRRMVDDDTIAILALEAAATEFPWSLAQYVDSLLANDDANVLEINEKIIGFIIFKSVLDETTLLNIAVHPNYQSQSYGRYLLEEGLAEQVSKGVTTCFLDVRLSNEKAQNLYRSLGFTVVGERKKYYPSSGVERENALVMSRQLSKKELGAY